MVKGKGKTSRAVIGAVAVVVCSRNAVLFGYTTDDPKADKITLRNARWAYYWVNEGGHLGLARTGPQKGSRVGAVGTVTLTDIACVIDASEGAQAWADYPVSTQ